MSFGNTQTKKKLLKYPIIISQCSSQSAAYAACIIAAEDVCYRICEKEFQNLKNCFQIQASKLGFKI